MKRREMEKRKRGDGAIEENTMAILDSGFSNPSAYISDDKISFLQAVRSSSLVPADGCAPTKKMYDAIFQILNEEDSLELLMASYRILIELDQRFPRVFVYGTEKLTADAALTDSLDLTVDEEAWSPFNSSLEISIGGDKEAKKSIGRSIDPSGFHLLIQQLTNLMDEESVPLKIKSLRNMLLFQYLVNVVEGDFCPRNCVFKANINWSILRESLLNMLLCSRKINYKALVKDSLSCICETSRGLLELCHESSCPESNTTEQKLHDYAIAMSFSEIANSTCLALQRLLLMMLDLDRARKIADTQGLTTRADSVRTPVLEIILDELMYNEDILSEFFQVFDEPKLKLEIIMHYFRKYMLKPSVRTRRYTGPNDDRKFDGVLRCLSNINSAKSLIKKMGSEIAQLLLARAFQACLALSCERSVDDDLSSVEEVGYSSLKEVCRNLISAFTCLGEIVGNAGILPLGKQALFTAASIVAASS